ncbi:ABC transporter ATP-binding protein [Azospirillum picis]|uniref:Iron complex transport system ATP-binding protein n=1 Tax=Azospirillum picis TaxID=488438 RepID=A0ABU0MI79_9PROT|nr:ABC transporter ATP-binding protein [Azospirillum picis]MBP2299271.1 iron complex transport system ATP-binding protein [Azospirillum picis]MDQ0533091.1 iron complex transport system ATP-binding protein [Azospirillum picis]
MLTVRALSVHRGGRALLDGVGFTARCGAVTGLIGPNGVGKSTLLRAVAGLPPQDATVRGGSLLFDGRPLPTMARERARLVGFLPQGHAVHWPLTVRRTVELGRLPHLGPLGRLRPEDHTAVERVMAATGIDGLSQRPVTGLSGGERARVMLARVLAGEAPLLLADEPAASLDPGHQLRLMEVLRAEAVERDRAVLVVLHDLSLAARCCDHLVLLKPGGGCAAGPTPAVLDPALLREAYGIPFAVTEAAGVPLVIPTLPPKSDRGVSRHAC